LWEQFKKKHGQTTFFCEIETLLNLVFKLERDVPSTISAQTSSEDIG